MAEEKQPANSNHLIFFTDLDGTLLDHDSYSYEPAQEALALLRKRNIPLILASSKTAAEVAPLRHAIGFQHCEAIVENGAGILLPGDRDTGSGEQYKELLNTIANMPPGYRDCFRGFAQWRVEELSELTGLTKVAAALAKERQFSEPGLWSGSDEDLEGFCGLLKQHGIVAQQGGRFLTLSFGGNKVDRMHEIMDLYRAGEQDRFCVALGDAPNDIAMLTAADLGIVIPNPSHGGIGKFSNEKMKNIVHARFSGPKGWNVAVLDVLRNTARGGLNG